MRKQSIRTGLWLVGGASAVVLLGISIAFFLFWQNPEIVRYKVYFPHGIVFEGMGRGYFDAQYWSVSIKTRGEWLSDGSLRRDPLDTNQSLKFRIRDEIVALERLTPAVLVRLGAIKAVYEDDERYFRYSINEEDGSCFFVFDENDSLVDFFVYAGFLGDDNVLAPKWPVVQLSWKDGDWFSLPLTTHDELVSYMGEPTSTRKYREMN